MWDPDSGARLGEPVHVGQTTISALALTRLAGGRILLCSGGHDGDRHNDRELALHLQISLRSAITLFGELEQGHQFPPEEPFLRC